MYKFLNETSQRLSIEILLTLYIPETAKMKTLELLEMTQEICERDYPALLESIGRERLQKAVIQKEPLQDIDWRLAFGFYEILLLYKLFHLFGDEANKKKVNNLFLKECSYISLLKKYIINGPPAEAVQWLSDLDGLVQAGLKEGISSLCLEMGQKFKEIEGYDLIVAIHEALDDYSTLSAEEYNKKLDSAIIEVFHQHLTSPSNVKDFFYTSLTNMGVHLAKDPTTGQFTSKDALEASLYLQSIRLRYILREFYPKESFGHEDKRNYRLQGILFDKVFFNEAAIEGRGLTYYKYSNSDWLLDHYLDQVIPHRPLAKSEWIGLYLASKEIDMKHFQQLFRIIARKEKDYKKSALGAFCFMAPRISLGSQIPDFNVNLDKIPLALSGAQKSLFKGLLFVSMWEKSSNSLTAQKAKNKGHREKSAIYRAIVSYYDREALHDLFIESSIENLGAVLKKASKLLNMADEGLDYSFFNLEGEITDSSDYTTLLYFFSRIERESKPALISVLNLLRERQLQYLPIIENDRVNEANHKKIQEIDGGFKLAYFQSTFYPPIDISLLQLSDWDNRYLYILKNIKFICEGDRVYTGPQKNDVDWLESNRKALHTVYLYKIRNQASHFTEDENVAIFMDPKYLCDLLFILIEASRIDRTQLPWSLQNKENDLWWDSIFRSEVPRYTRNHISCFIKVLCLIAGEKGHPEIASLPMEIGFNELEAYLKDRDKPAQLSSYKLTEEERSRILAKLKCADGFCPPPFRARDKTFDLAEHYLTYFEEILRDTLRFLFSSEVQNYYERTQENSFLKTYHAESAFYMLHLAPALFNNPNITQSKE